MKKVFAGILGASLLLAGCGTSNEPTKQPESTTTPAAQVSVDETKTADVIVVGAGGAGLSAAISAVDNGAEHVLIVEKTSTTGGSLNYTSGSMSGAETIIQEIDGIEDTKESYVQDILSNGAGLGNEEMIRAFADEDVDAIQWLWDNGLSDNKFSTDRTTGTMSVFAPEHQLYSVKRTYKASPDNSEKYKSAAHEILDTVAASYPQIEIDFSTTADQLMFNEQNQVTGVLAHSAGKTIEYVGTRGVIMATGGYSGNQTLMAQFTQNGGSYLPGGASTADGYGIYMMQEVGANIDPECMSYIPTFPMGLDTGNGPGKIASTYMWKTGGICVNQEGNRFVDETEPRVDVHETALEEQTGAVQYDIFTDKIIADAEEKNSSVFWNYFYAPEKPYHDFVVEADSLDELAEKLGVNAENLKKTVEEYNACVASGKTDSFGREYTEESIDGVYNVAVNPIEGDHYYAVPLHALCVMTLGGVTTNTNTQVLDTDGNVIPGLYAAGECVGGIWGKFVSGGTGVMGPIAFGRIAGRTIMSNELTEGYTQAEVKGVIKQEWVEKSNEGAVTFETPADLKDGTYTSTVDGQEGPMTVEVVIEGSKIASVTVVEANESSFTADAQVSLPEAIVGANSIDVDDVTGATLTSGRIKTAVKNCLEEASK